MNWRDFIARLRGRQKAYIYRNGEDNPIAIIWTNSAPLKDEIISLWDGEKFTKYKVIGRIFGVNTPSKTACWNIYTKEVVECYQPTDAEIEDLMREIRELNK